MLALIRRDQVCPVTENWTSQMQTYTKCKHKLLCMIKRRSLYQILHMHGFSCTVFNRAVWIYLQFIFLFFSEQNSGISSFYIQGKRINGWSPYLYNDGTTITYFNWSTGQPSGVGLYLATASADTRMQTDDGTSPRSYVCAVYPPTSLPARWILNQLH